MSLREKGCKSDSKSQGSSDGDRNVCVFVRQNAYVFYLILHSICGSVRRCTCFCVCVCLAMQGEREREREILNSGLVLIC